MQKFQRGDKVQIISGKDKGRKGEIERVFPKRGKVLIPGLNVYKKHVKGFGEQKSGIYDLPRPMHLSKVAVICPKCKKPTRIGFKYAGDEKVRICKKCGKEIKSKDDSK
jgi:large subunit ribosomal protein L24